MKKIAFLTIFLSLSLSLLTSCGIGKKLKDFHDPPDLRTEPLDPDERAKRNIEEGRGISILGGRSKDTTYEFSTSNPMWRASLETLDFIPLKITVRFLSNEIRTDSLKIVVHKKNCKVSMDCNVTLLPSSSKLNSELLAVILRKASMLEAASKNKNKKKKK